MIIPVFKKSGQSTHLLAKQLGEMYSVKATHTGTLDPLAEGVIVVLTGADRFDKPKLTDWSKIYDANIMLGVSTDTDDELGLITERKNVSATEIKKFIDVFAQNVGTHQQLIHAFSAKRVNGTSYFDLAKSNTPPPDYYQSILIDSITFTNESVINVISLLDEQQLKVAAIQGDFRQQKIIENWKNEIDHIPDNFPLITFTLVCSKRTYIRSLVRDVSKKTGIPAVLHHLTRTYNGPYSIADCICLI